MPPALLSCFLFRRYGATNISDNLLNNIWLPGVGTVILNLTVTSEQGPWGRWLHARRVPPLAPCRLLTLSRPSPPCPLPHLWPAVYLAISIPPIFHAVNHTIHSWLLQMFPRHYAGITRPWVQRLIVNCCSILPW